MIKGIEQAWSENTSALPQEWSPENPSRGQCAVTALVVQDLHGGELMRTTVGGESHYLNQLPDGVLVDITKEQFHGADYDTPPEPRTRVYVLSFPATRQRYARLVSNLWD